MSVSVSLLPLLLLLAPGLGALLGITIGSFRSTVRQSPPALGSMMALIIVLFGSMLAHGAGLVVDLMNVAFCDRGCPIHNDAAVGLYAAAFRWWNQGSMPNAATIAALLGDLIILTVASAAIAGRWTANASNDPDTAYILYGWLATQAERPSPTSPTIAAIVTLKANGSTGPDVVQGLVREINLGPQREILSITLANADYKRVIIDDDHTAASATTQRLATWHGQMGEIAHFALRAHPVAGHA